MFLKKRPADLPKAPDLEQVKDFSLFSDGAASKSRQASARPSEPGSRYRAPVVDAEIIDVEVIERTEEAAAQPVSSHAVQPPAPAPAPEGTPDASAPTPERDAEPVTSNAKPGLKILRKKPAAAPAADTPPPVAADACAPNPPRSSWADRVAASIKRQPAKAAPPTPAQEPATTEAGGLASKFFSRRAKPAEAPAPQTAEPNTAEEQANPLSRFARKAAHTRASSEDEAIKAASSSRKGLGAFARRKEATTDSLPPQEAGRAKSLKGLWRGKKSAKPSSATPAQPRRATPKGSLDILVELEGGRRVFWRVGTASFEELSEPVAKAVSFSRNEHRFHVESGLSFSGAQDLALAEVGEDVRIVNASRQLRAVYASTSQRVAELQPVTIGPGLLLVDELLRGEKSDGEELLCALVLKGADEATSLAVLYHYNDRNEVAATQITVNPDNLNFVLAQFASSRRLEVANTKVVLFGNDDLLRVAGKAAYYPAETVWQGVPVRTLLWGATAVAAAAAAAGALYAGQAYVRLQSVQSKAVAANSDYKSAQKQIDDLLNASVVSFAKTQTIALGEITERAGEFWTPGAKVVVDATAKTQAYSVMLPLTRGTLLGNRPSVLHQTNLAHVEPLLKKETPEGCSRALPEVSGGMNAVQITITCESLAGPLSGYGID